MSTKGKTEATSTSALEAILNAGKSDESKSDRQWDEEQHVEPGPAPENADDTITTALPKVITNEIKSQVANLLATVLVIGEEAVEQIYRIGTLSARERIRNLVYDVVDLVILDQIRTFEVIQTINKQVNKYSKVCEAAEALCNRMPHNDDFPAQIASMVYTKAMVTVTEQRRLDVFRSVSIANGAKLEAALAPEASLLHEGLARTNSKRSSSKESYKRSKSNRPYY